jgi:hypothetical protein
MMTNYSTGDGESFIIPSRTLRGSRKEMVQDIDQAIVGLLALRHLIGAGGSPVRALALQHGRVSLLQRALRWLALLSARLTERRDGRGSPEVS